MNIHLCTYSTRPRGGVVHTLALAEALARLGQQVTVWTLARGGDTAFFRPVDRSVRVRAIPFPDMVGENVGARVLRSIDTLARCVDTTGADVVHAQDCISANALTGCIRTVHHIDHFTTPELAGCHERALRTPVAHVCVSRSVAVELAAGWGIHGAVIPNGVDALRFEAAAGPDAAADRQLWRNQLGGDPLVVTVGGIEPRKGSVELLEAVGLARRTRPGIRLAIAGGETLFDYRDYRAVFDRRKSDLDLDVEVLGPVDHDALPALIAAADVFAFPSTKEGFGLAAMEALAAGVPVVASDLPVLREVFGDAVQYGCDAPSLAQAIMASASRDGGDDDRRRAGQALARSYTWDAAARAHLDLYERIT
jgi:glycosyltransferase-like protein